MREEINSIRVIAESAKKEAHAARQATTYAKSRAAQPAGDAEPSEQKESKEPFVIKPGTVIPEHMLNGNRRRAQ